VANNFSKEETVMFDQVVEGFDDLLVIAKSAEKYIPATPQEMERSSDRIWRPMPYIAVSYDGFDQSANFGDITQLAVPVNTGYHKSVPGKLTSKDLRDPSQLKRYGDAAMQKLSSDVNFAAFTVAALQGSIVSKRTGAATGFDDVAQVDALMTEIGVNKADRRAFYSSRDYNGMSGNLASRVLDNSKSLNAYEEAYVGRVSGVETYKNDQTYRLAAAVPGAGVTINGANQYYTPQGHTTDASGNTTNVDNRYQTLNVTVGAGGAIKAGDAFNIAGVDSVHLISKQDTGQAKSFRIVNIVSGGGTAGANVVTITPPIISGGGGTKAELEYQNVSATPANGAALTFLNTTTAAVNPFFVKPALEIIPGSFAVDPEDGWQVLRATTDFGIGITYTRQGNINDLTLKYRWDIDFGVGPLNTEMMGIQMFGQA
jgi:hypothetical protein